MLSITGTHNIVFFFISIYNIHLILLTTSEINLPDTVSGAEAMYVALGYFYALSIKLTRDFGSIDK